MKNERGLKIHIGKAHKVLKTPEKERFAAVEKEPVLTLSPTPLSGREQEDNTSSPEKIIDSDDPHEITTCIKCHFEIVHPDDIYVQCRFCSHSTITEKEKVIKNYQ